MDLSQLRTRVRRLSGVRLTELLPDDDLDALLNEAYRELMGLRQWPFLRRELDLSAAQGDPQLSVATPMRHIEGVALSNGRRLRQVTVHDLDRLEDREDVPELYARRDERTLTLWPTPAEQTPVRVWAQESPVDMVATSDAPVFEEEFHPTLAYMAAARVLAEEGDDSGRAQMYADEATSFIRRMEDRYLAAQDAGVFVMGGGRQRVRTF